MTQTDNRILELLDKSGLLLTPAVLAKNLDYNRSWVSQRLSKLRESGLVENTEGSFYRITDRGQAYLTGDLDAEDLETESENY